MIIRSEKDLRRKNKKKRAQVIDKMAGSVDGSEVRPSALYTRSSYAASN